VLDYFPPGVGAVEGGTTGVAVGVAGATGVREGGDVGVAEVAEDRRACSWMRL